MIADIFKEMQRQLVGERKQLTGLPMGTTTMTQQPSVDFATLSRDGYEKNALIFACINELASSASEAKAIVEVKNRKGEWEARPEHRLQKLLDRPSPIISAYEFWFHVILYQSLAGNCYYEKERSKAGLVVGLWLMRPDYVSIKAVTALPGERVKKKIAGYEWRKGAEVLNFPGGDVIHFKHPHPRNELYGFPPLAAAARAGDTDNLATDFVQSFFKNAAVPFGLLKTKGTFDEAEAERVKQRLQQMYGVISGTARWFEPLVLGDDADWVEIGKSFQDMDFPQLRLITETRICEVFQVPPILVGSFAGTVATTYANYAEARKSFWLETLMPIYKKHADTLNLQLTPEFGKDIRVRFDFSAVKALQEEEAAVFTRANESISAGYLTVNEARLMVGLEEVPGGDVFLRPMMLMPVSAEEKPAAPGAKMGSLRGHLGSLGVKSVLIPEEAKERWAKTIDMVAAAHEGPFAAKAKELFDEEKVAILKILRREGKQAKQGVAYSRFLLGVTDYMAMAGDKWREGFLPMFRALIRVQGENIAAAFGLEFDINNETTIAFLESYVMEFAEGIVSVTGDKVDDIILLGQKEGWTVAEMRKALTSQFEDKFDKVRAEMIARTETIRSSNAGAMEAYRQANLQRVEWYATLDGRQCPECEVLHAMEPISIGGRWDGYDYPPAHPNCRCTVLPVIEEV